MLVLLALLAPGLILAMMLGWKPLLFGHMPDEASVSFRQIDHLATGAAAGLTYAWFLWPITNRLLAHVVIVLLAAEAVQSMAGLLLGDSIADAFVWQTFFVDALYAAVGLTLVVGWRSVRLNMAS